MTLAPGAPRPTRPSHSGLWQLQPIADYVRLPDGRSIESVGPVELRGIVASMGIDVAPSAGHLDVARAYKAHVEGIYDTGGRVAVKAWLGGTR